MLYSMRNGKVVIDDGVLRIPEFKVLWERDDSPNKKRANAELDFIYAICDYRSSYRRSYRDEELLEAVTNDFMFRFAKWEVDSEMTEAMKKYNELRDTSSFKDYKAIDKSMGQIRHLCNTFAIPEVNSEDGIGIKERLEIAKLHLDLVSRYESAVTAMVAIKKKVEEDVQQMESKNSSRTKVRDRERRMEERRQTL